MNTPLRLLLSLAAGLLVALALFWLMQWMIAPGDDMAERPPGPGAIEFSRAERDERPQTRERVPPEEPEMPEQPESLPELEQPREPEMPRPDMALAELDLSALGAGPSLGVGDGLLWAGEATPMVRIEPQYPRRALSAGIEGHVELEFTIDRDGSVIDVTVVEAEPPGVFDTEAVRALNRWRFRPHVVDGEPRQRRARQTIHFTLEE